MEGLREMSVVLSSGSESSRLTSSETKDEDSPLRDQLSKAGKRIADLETRVHDLTLQTTMVSLSLESYIRMYKK